jgi:hypothetical protein
MSNFNTSFQISVPGAGTPQFVQSSNGNLTIAGTLTQLSTKEAKQEFEAVEPLEVLQKVVSMPITSWAYKADPTVRHIGPMAEDFHQNFSVGDNPKGISVTDSQGVAFAAIQGLNQIIAAKDKEIADLKARLDKIEAMLQPK